MCTGCKHNVKPSPYVGLLSWLASITAACQVDMDDLPLTTWEDLGVYKTVTQPRLM